MSKKQSTNITTMKNNKELVKRTTVEETPFTIITIENEGSFISMGKYRMSKVMENEEECKKYVHEKPWEFIMAIMHVMAEEAITQWEIKIEQIKNNITNEKHTEPNNNNTKRHP